MAWVYLDDQFPDHPKVVAAGDAAAWLFVCGLAYCRRYATHGRIPKGQIAKLTGHRTPAKLAAALCRPPVGYTAGLWEDHGDHYLVHDYDEWNKPQASRSEAARKAAKSRWDKQQGNAPPDADAYANALPDASETQCEVDAEGNASGCPPPLTPTGENKSSSELTLVGDRPDEDDNHGQHAPDQHKHDPIAETALAILAQRDLAARQQNAQLTPIGDTASYLAACIETRRGRHAETLTELRHLDPDATPEQLADALEPDPLRPEAPANGDTPPRPPEHVADAEPSPWLGPSSDLLAATREHLARHTPPDRSTS